MKRRLVSCLLVGHCSGPGLGAGTAANTQLTPTAILGRQPRPIVGANSSRQSDRAASLRGRVDAASVLANAYEQSRNSLRRVCQPHPHLFHTELVFQPSSFQLPSVGYFTSCNKPLVSSPLGISSLPCNDNGTCGVPLMRRAHGCTSKLST